MARSRNNALEFSSAGSAVLLANGSVTGNFGAIQFLHDSTLTELHASNITNKDGLLLKTYGAGTILYGSFTRVDISNGLAMVHKV